MTKSVLLLFSSLFYFQLAYSQFSIVDDSTDMRIQSSALEKIDKRFRLDKDNDFELRLWIFPKTTDKSTNLSLFILSNKSGSWNARLFQNAWSKEKMNEAILKKEELEQLWKNLNNNNVLTIPKAWTLIDKKGDNIIQDADEVLFSFELLTKQAVRHYAYKCPDKFSREYNYIEAYKNVAAIIKYIIDFAGLNISIICATNSVQHQVSYVYRP